MEEYREEELTLPAEPMLLHMGPSHPAMHGTVRCVVKLDGETVVGSDVQIGYLHRGFEKECEWGTWTQVFPYTDRLNYASPLLNNIGYALAVEKLLGLQVPARCQYIRVILGELARICDHSVCSAAMAMELGAFTVFLYLVKAREWIFDILEEVTGARVTHAFCRIGGLRWDLPENFADRVRSVLPKSLEAIHECEQLLLRNRIFMDRTMGVGTITPERALAWGWTGPCLRSTGVAYDVRKAHPYLVYEDLDFDIPVGSQGDNYDRFVCRLEEIRQSARIVMQALDKLPDGPIAVPDDTGILLPQKLETYTTIERTIQHFKIIMEGIQVPPGEVYSYSEAANGELGFYLVSNGSGKPWKCRVRPPCFANVQALSELTRGRLLPDIIPTFGSINMIGGECDR
ncbi:MAG: NADH-quinone oxidoreductase subunit D [Acidobacteria bacterium]|nr:NADH-quinone oxidoreductase subunit D [Acidobacteriota bacterium]